MNQQDADGLPQVVVSKKRSISIVWLVPLLAAGIAGYLAFDAIRSRGIPITITFNDGSGLVAGKTQLKFNGLPVGTVDSFKIGSGMRSVIVQATLNKSAAGAATKGTQYWIVRPELGITGVTGLDALVTGAYIELEPGRGQPQYNFEGLDEAPPSDVERPGIEVALRAASAGSLRVGSPVYYRQISVGAVSKIELAQDSRHVMIGVHIDEKYKALIRENTVFWNASGLDFSLGLLGIGAHLDVESLESLLAGGVSLATPDDPGPPAAAGTVFELKDKQEDEYLEWSPTIELKASATTQAGASTSDTGSTQDAGSSEEATPPDEQPPDREHSRERVEPMIPRHLR